MFKFKKSISYAVVITLLLGVCFVVSALAQTSGKRFRIKPHQLTMLSYENIKLEVPKGAIKKNITIGKGNPNLDGIEKPYGFVAVGRPYRFGPHGLKFKKDKKLKFRMRINPKDLPTGITSDRVKLFYINREEKRLEEVREQKVDTETHVLEAELEHFSEYVPGVTPGWDGNGIRPYMDYVHNGEEHVSLSNLGVCVISPIISLPGRGGMDLKLSRITNTTSSSYNGPLTINEYWRWDIPYFDDMLYLPGGGAYQVPPSTNSNASSYSRIYQYEDVRFTAYYRNSRTASTIVLKDGTILEKSGYSIKQIDPNGHWIKYNVSDLDQYTDVYRLTSIEDSSGHKLKFTYNSGRYDLKNVVQILTNGTERTILSYKNNSFTDALGRKTSYSITSFNVNGTFVQFPKNVTYPNGVRSEYSIKKENQSGQFIYYLTHNLFLSGQTQPFRQVTYKRSFKDNYTEVNDGKSIKKYLFKTEDHYPEYTYCEQTFTTSGKLLKQIDYSLAKYGNTLLENNLYSLGKFMRRTETKVRYAKSDGTLGTPATTTYQYDNAGNITRIVDPDGAETRFAYANTDSRKDLSAFNSIYQNALYTTGVGYNQLLTKATLIKDPVHNTTQLKQTHYQYDSRGNLVLEREAYNGTYLDTAYGYDGYGNLTSKTDAKGSRINFEYSSAYNSVFPTRVYKADNTTIATYVYDFNLGTKTRASDPKGNIYCYSYDAIGRLTKEWLDNPDPKLGVIRNIIYNDSQNTVLMRYGNDTEGWQEGLITYHPVFGKPQILQRKLNGNWVTLKQYVFDNHGRVIQEKDNLGHTTIHGYDSLDRKIKTQLPDGATTNWEWNDRTLTITDPKVNKKTQIYDLLDRLVESRESPDGTTIYSTKYTYDTASNLVKVTNPKNAETLYTFDNLGRLTRVDYPQDGENPMAPEIYEYDNVGNLINKTGAKGIKSIDYEFFAGYRVKQIREPDGRVIINDYDNNDNLLHQSWGTDSYHYTYNARNQVTNFTASLGGNNFAFDYTYDVFGRVIELGYPGRSEKVSYTYDEMDRLQKIPGFVNTCSYDGDNKLTEMLLANGIKNSFNYDLNDRPLNIKSAGLGAFVNLEYEYDSTGNITRLNGDYYEYDNLNRLVWSGNRQKDQAASSPWGKGTAWRYDEAGNRIAQEVYSHGQIGEGISLGYDLANRLWSKGSTTYDNDTAGARTGKRDGTTAWSYQYDAESRMTQALKNGTVVLENGYDPAGMRIKKSSQGKTTYTVYSGANPILEYDQATGEYTYYIYAGTRSVAEEKGSKKTFYHRDHLGSTRATTDDTGKITGLCKYDAWGNLESVNEFDEGLINGDFELNHNDQIKYWIPKNEPTEIVTMVKQLTLTDFDLKHKSDGYWMDFNGDGEADYITLIGNEETGYGYQVNLSKNLATESIINILVGDDLGYEDERYWVDFNGDGKTDYICLVGDPGNYAYKVYLSTGTGIGLTFEIPYKDYNLDECYWVDFNGDGYTDFISLAGVPGNYAYKVYLSTGNGFSSAFEVLAGEDLGHANGRYWVDFNGDGNTDYICLVGDPENYAYKVYLSTGTGFSPAFEVLLGEDLGYVDGRYWVDFNGDGNADYVCLVGDPGNYAYKVYLSNGTEIGSIFEVLEGEDLGNLEKQYWLDFNGDGKTDYICLFDNHGNFSYKVYLSNGVGFNSPFTILNGENLGIEDRRYWIDFNGDRKTDYVCVVGEPGNYTYKVYLSTGTGIGRTFEVLTDQDFEFNAKGYWVDFNGDKKRDYVCQTSNLENYGYTVYSSEVVAIQETFEDCTYQPGQGINGSSALRIERISGSTNTAWTLPNIYASPDTNYELTGYYLSGNAQSNKARAQLVYYNTAGEEIAIHDTGALGHSGEDWKQFTLTSHAPADAASMEIRLTQDADPGMAVLFDGIKLKIPGLAGKYDYTGKKEDPEIGLKYFGARFYDPEIGRFITQDPIKDGANWFAYCENNPLTNFDPDGNRTISTESKNIYFTYTDSKTNKEVTALAATVTTKTTETLIKNCDGSFKQVIQTTTTTKINTNTAGYKFAENLRGKENGCKTWICYTIGGTLSIIQPEAAATVIAITSSVQKVIGAGFAIWQNIQSSSGAVTYEMGGTIIDQTTIITTGSADGHVTNDVKSTYTVWGSPTTDNPDGEKKVDICYDHENYTI